jgi:hypothetical protein
MTIVAASAESAPEDVPRWGYWPTRLLFNPWLWLGLANVAMLSAAVVATLRQRYVTNWPQLAEPLPDPRWIVALALVGLVVVVAKPGIWAVGATLVSLMFGLAIFINAVFQHVVWVLPSTRAHPEPRLISPPGWQEWIDTPMRAEGVTAAIFVGVSLVGFVATVIVAKARGRPLRSDSRWWVAAGSFAILVVGGVALLRLWHTQDTMHRELGSMGFVGLAIVGLAALLVALVVRQQEAAWVAVITLGVAAAMGCGPALAWIDQTKAWPGRPAVIHQSMVVEGLTALLLGGIAALVAVVLQMRDRLARPDR